jgi:hypothetical protein
LDFALAKPGCVGMCIVPTTESLNLNSDDSAGDISMCAIGEGDGMAMHCLSIVVFVHLLRMLRLVVGDDVYLGRGVI